MATKPRPKRDAEAFSRTKQAVDSINNKRPRFDTRNPAALAADAPEEDEILDIDEIGRRGAQAKRNAVNIDGFESDSSNEGFDARAAAKAKEAKKKTNGAGSKDEEMDDMFGDLDEQFADGDEDDPADGVDGKKSKKQVKFLDMDDIEGQSKKSKSGGHVSSDFRKTSDEVDEEVESSSDEEVPDELRADVEDVDEELGAGAKKKHAPKLDAFNLRDENEEGGFDEHGNFVRKARDPDALYDSWMDGVSKKDMKKAKEAHEQRQKEQRDKRLEDDSKTVGEILEEMIGRMDSGETVLEALSRLGRGKEKKKPKWQERRRIKQGVDMNIDVESNTKQDTAELQRKADVEAITGAADLLLSRGDTDIYEKDRELLIRTYKKETGEDWQDKTTGSRTVSRQWMYRWADARDGGEAHGPYDGPTMMAWNDAGYFGEGVEFREVGEGENDTWHREVDF
ncbi:MAG: hypothetical protein GOMPHAMPRED_005966 [Gomphillus americanus]|uniref:GYF domain-containing protein n=1 Tax=Gomphillus americanus TaxID=1940652 RepID=A0A8H3FYM4_9LECA|nr:MAG: hypothetical protein GOMPHAMPRED_005966 [Gomphillus americanus]